MNWIAWIIFALLCCLWVNIFVCNYWDHVGHALIKLGVIRSQPKYMSPVPFVGTLIGCGMIYLAGRQFPSLPGWMNWLVLIPDLPVIADFIRLPFVLHVERRREQNRPLIEHHEDHPPRR